MIFPYKIHFDKFSLKVTYREFPQPPNNHNNQNNTNNTNNTTNTMSTTSTGSRLYESSKAVDEYIQMHYASPKDLFPYEEQYSPLPGLLFLLCVCVCVVLYCVEECGGVVVVFW